MTANDKPRRQKTFLLNGQPVAAAALAPGLYVTATPIGHLGDITLRALETLAAADLILCEDTRTTVKLVRNYGISTPLKAYHEHNAERMRPEIMTRLGAGGTIALVSDAGTPLVSDPGFKLVRDAAAGDVTVFPVPGASALLAALAVAGQPTDRFQFVGFLPEKKGARDTALAELAGIQATLIFFVSPRKVTLTLEALLVAFGDRGATLTRELTKMHEEIVRGTLTDLVGMARDRGTFKGEITLVVAPGETRPPGGEEIDKALRAALAEMSVRDAADHVARALAVPRKQVYRRALDLSHARDGEER